MIESVFCLCGLSWAELMVCFAFESQEKREMAASIESVNATNAKGHTKSTLNTGFPKGQCGVL